MSDRGQQGRGRSGHRGQRGRGAQGGGGGSGSESGAGSGQGRGRGQHLAPSGSISRDSSVSSVHAGAPSFRGRGRGDSISRESSASPMAPRYDPRGRGSSGGRGGGYGPPRGHGGPPPHARGSGGGGPRGGFGGGRGGSASGPYTQDGGPEARLTAQEQNSLVALLSRVKISSTPSTSSSASGRSVASPYAIRPGFGTKGRSVNLYANFFALRYPRKVVLYDYVIAVKPDVSKKARERARVFEALESAPEFEQIADNVAHDSAQRLITNQPLPDGLVINVNAQEPRAGNEPPKVTAYQITFPEYNELNTAELERYLQADPAYADYNTKPIISAFQMITTYFASKQGVRFGTNRYYFSPDLFGENRRDLSPGLEAWKGFFTSVRPVYKQLMVNVNVCMSPFFVPTQSLVQAWDAYQRESRGAGPPQMEFFQKMNVTTTYLGYRKKSAVKGFGNLPDRTTFDCPELGGKITVTQYFQKKYNIQLQNKNAPLVNTGPRANKNKDIWVPMELCSIEAGQPYRGLLSENGTANMIRFACNPPGMNANTIVNQGLPMLGYEDEGGTLAGFDIDIEPRMTIIPARIMDPPRVQYSSGQPRVQNGSWNVLGVKFNKPASLVGFSVLILNDNGRDDFAGNTDPALRQIIQGFIEKCKACGMTVSTQLPQLRFTQPLPPSSRDDPLRSRALTIVQETILTYSPKPTLILVFMSSKDPHLYPGLKKLCDMTLGVPTVCMLNAKVRKERGQDQYFSNIALKVNTKLGGVNHQLDGSSMQWLRNTMLVGMDVTHPAPGSVKGLPSIVAVVASCDEKFMHYPASMRLQKPDPNRMSKEEIDEVREMMVERLLLYRKKSGKLPDRIVIFRDGVAENQYEMVLNNELPRIKAAFRSLDHSYKPKLTLAICAKRHHARFFVQNPGDADRTGNTQAGTVVDQGVTSVFDFDFYLQAHACLQGTVRSTHYTILHDENKYPADDIQGGTNSLSYMWARATKSVSLVPPAYWADTACERGRCYLRELIMAPDRRLNEDQVWQRATQLWGQGVHESIKDTMYYL